ncbi:sensor histidine kinase [Cohnella zeiphila]|uniref:histidine kinase n=1 Tax=Cohnella zeiphila TaxID=2761120 RepID=A0A7X0STQ9_9BACL|nr:sensor histidine kinase [Cohnella zeiphila]MBB6735935.1 sensor histidine kinase [Cohnella zeiphila]
MIKRLFVPRSIRAKIVWSTVLISLLPLLILSFLFYRTSARSLEQTMIRSSDQNAEYLSGYLNQYFHNISTSALQVYGFERITNMMKHGVSYNDPDVLNLNESLKNYYLLVQNKNLDIIKIMIYGKDNKLEDSWSRASSYDAIRFEQSVPNYKEMLDLPFQHTMMFTYSDDALHQDFFVYTITIYDPFYREKFGTLVFYIKSTALAKIVESNNRPPNVIVLQNGRGDAFYRTNGKYEGIVQKYVRSDQAVSPDPRNITFAKNKDLLVGTSYLDDANIALTIVYPNTELARNRRNTLLITIGALLFVMAVISLFSLLAQQYVTRPIQRLGRAMKAVRSGNFHMTLKTPKHRDDLSELTRNFNFMTDKIRELIETEYQAQLRNKEAQILALQMQINPHFLYNTLQTIGGKAVLAGDYEIHEMCRALGDMFRYSFYEGNLESTIGQELAHVNNYLYLQQLRFEDLLLTEFDVDASLMDCSVIRFVLQPMIENVVIHGLGKRERQLKLNVGAFREQDDVVIELKDDGPGIEPARLAALQSGLERRSYEVFSGVSIGLKNVHERIRLAYGPAYGLTVDSEAGAGTRVAIRIPYKKRGTEFV